MRKYIKIIIADDDAIILRGMRKFIDWNQYGFEIIAMVDNGKELIKLCETEEVDAIITDIQMPKLNGLEAMNNITQINKNIKLIVISGFEKFEYAKQAIQYGVYAYLLKPINPVELIGVLNKLKAEFFQPEIKEDVNVEGYDIAKIINEVKRKIDQNEDDEINLEYIQARYYISPTYFSKAFKEMVGMNFTHYRTCHKMLYAKYLLEHTNFRLYEIAEKLKYEDERYFSRVFKKFYGKTPREWRDSN